MDNTFIVEKSKLLRQLQCPICLGAVKNARLCPHCSQFYCKDCIYNRLSSKFSRCPNCGKAVRYNHLVVGRSIDELQQSITRMMGCMEENQCDNHKQQLTLYCYCCEVNICVGCWFLPEHADHKEWVVPLEDAYEHYRQTLKTALVWVDGQNELIHDGLKQVANIQKDLNAEREDVEGLRDDAAELVAGKASPTALIKIISIVERIEDLRSERQRDIVAIRVDRRGDFMLEPTAVVFCIPEFGQVFRKKKRCVLAVTDSNGFVWKCLMQEAETDEEDDDESCEKEEKENNGEQHIYYDCFLSLLEGKPSEYSVTFDDRPEKVLLFELGKNVLMGRFKPEVDKEDDSGRVTFYIRQTYSDRIQQLKGRIAQLEKKCAELKSFRSSEASLPVMRKA